MNYLLTLSFVILYISSCLISWFVNGFEIVLLSLYILSSLIVIVSSKLISIGKLFSVMYFALNFSSIVYYTFFSDDGGTYLFITHLSFSIFLLGYILFGNGKDDYEEFDLFNEISRYNIRFHKIMLLFIPLIFSVVLMVVVYGPAVLLDVSLHSRSDTKEATGMIWLISKYSLMLYLPCAFLQGFSIRKDGVFNGMIFLLTFSFLMFIVFLFLRTRTYLVGPLVSLFLGYLVATVGSVSTEKFEIKTSVYIKIAIIGFIIITLSASVRFIRGIMEAGEGGLNFMLVAERTLVGGDLGYGNTINEVIVYSDENDERLYGQSYYRLLFVGVPRSIFPDKPENTQRIVGRWLYSDAIFMTVPPGIQGDAYINFGVLGVLIFFIYGCVFRLADNRNSQTMYIFIGSSFMPMFHLTRGGFTNPIIIFMLLYIFSLIVVKCFAKSE